VTSVAGVAGRRVLVAAALGGAPMEVLDFLLPLWAGSTLKAGASTVGALIAVEAVLSLLVRPLAGELADRHDPRRVSAIGALLYALSFVGYAVADSLAPAFVAAALGGAGGALFWVALDAWTGRRTAGDATAAYGKLLSVSGQGAFVGYLVAFTLMERGGYRTLFWVGAAACVVAAALLLPRPGEKDRVAATEPVAAPDTPRGAGQRRLLPLMSVAAVTAGAEAGLWMLLLQLQDRGLTPTETALVFAPGLLVLILLPEHAHRLTDRIGRTRTMAASFVASAAFAGGLALVSTPLAVAVLWTLVAACFAAQIPVEQATVAAAADGRIGRAMGRYESARLVGVLVGTPLLGVTFEAWGWTAACLVTASTALLAALVAPFAIRTLRLPEQPRGERGAESESGHEPEAGPEPYHAPDHEQKENEPLSGDDEKMDSKKEAPAAELSPKEHARKERKDWLFHTVVFMAAQAALWAFDSSWLVFWLQDEPIPDESRGWLMWAGRIWLTIWIIDTVWSWSYTVFPREKRAKA
jgi:MFS family permease